MTNINYEVIARTFGQEVSEALAEGLKAVWASVQCLDPADYAGGAVPWEALTAMAGLNTLLGEGSNVESLNELDAGRAARLAIWELNGPPSWFEPLVRAHRSAVVDALRPWIERDAQTSEESSSMRRSIEMAFRCSPDIGAMLLAPILQLIADGRIENQETLRRVATTLRTGEQISSDTFIDLCQSELLVSLSPDGIVGEIHWLYAWLSEDAFSAWHWFERHVDSFPGKRAANTP